MPGLVVKPRSRIFHGHDWVYASEIKKTFGHPEPGGVISLKDFRDRPLGSAIYNPASQIVARRFSRRTQDLDAAFFERRISRARDHRRQIGFTDAEPHRLVWSESDGLPGLVIDRFGAHFVLQSHTLAMDLRKAEIAAVLVDHFDAASVIERNDNAIRRAEGLEPVTGLLAAPPPDPLTVEARSGIRFDTHLMHGQKTGLYLDQFDNYQAVARLAKGKRVLDCFTNQGGFALHCAAMGAAEVVAVDISEHATAATEHNARLNNLNIDTQTANVFDFLKSQASAANRANDAGPEQSTPRFDLIILDPPSFTRSKKRLRDAIRGYKEIHLRALQMLAPGGMLATFCCSHHVSDSDFLDAIRSAAVDAKKNLRRIELRGQRRDHPVIPTLPETEYLNGHLLEVIPAW